MDGRNSIPGRSSARPRAPIVAVTLVFIVVLILVALGGLLSGAEWLTRPTPLWSALPLGNLAIWQGLVGLSVLLVLATTPGTWLRRLGLMSLILSLCWSSIGYWLSGNWGFNFFHDQDYQTWRVVTVATIALPVLGLSLIGLRRLWGVFRHEQP